MRAILAVALVMACDEPTGTPPSDSGVVVPPDARDVRCPGESISGPFDPTEPLYGEACEPGARACRPDPSVPGDWAGVCVEGICRPWCAFSTESGVAAQCCLRGGVKATTADGYCVCVPPR